MSRTVTLVTPENITVTYQLAGVATRFMALIIDLFIQGLLILAVDGGLGQGLIREAHPPGPGDGDGEVGPPLLEEEADRVEVGPEEAGDEGQHEEEGRGAGDTA